MPHRAIGETGGGVTRSHFEFRTRDYYVEWNERRGSVFMSQMRSRTLGSAYHDARCSLDRGTGAKRMRRLSGRLLCAGLLRPGAAHRLL